MSLLHRQLRMGPSQYPDYRWRIAQVNPLIYAPTDTRSGCGYCPAREICATHNHFDNSGEIFESDRYLHTTLSEKLIALAAKNIPGLGLAIPVTADRIKTSHIAPLLPCTESPRYLGRAKLPNDHNHWIIPTSVENPLIQIMKKIDAPSGHWSDDI